MSELGSPVWWEARRWWSCAACRRRRGAAFWCAAPLPRRAPLPADAPAPQAKAEFTNPGGSTKDRVARQMVLDALEDGSLRAGGTVVEGTSGSTGISLALMANGAWRGGCRRRAGGA